jgi:hypothetical protein
MRFHSPAAVVVALAVWLASCGPAAVAARVDAAPPAPPFLEQVNARFDAWDRDHDGTLSVPEIDAAVADPKVTGPEAAAIVALKRATRSKRYRLPPSLTRDAIRGIAASASAAKSPERAGRAEEQDGPGMAEPSVRSGQPNLAAMYAGALSRLSHTKGSQAKNAPSPLFASGMPGLSGIRQGKLGDCFCLAPLGAMLARNPGDVAARFRQQADGTYRVLFGAGRRVVCVTAPTDAEIALGAAAGPGEMWVNLYEKAVGTARIEDAGRKAVKKAAKTAATGTTADEADGGSTTTPSPAAATLPPLDLASRGGSAGTMLSVLTGNRIVRFSCRFAKDATTTAEERAGKLEELRAMLVAAVKERRLITCGTIRTTTPGITPNHAYAVLGYDLQTDAVRLWNPHGDGFTPKGPAGLKHGYPRADGIFSIPLSDLVDQFSGLAFETATPCDPSELPLP